MKTVQALTGIDAAINEMRRHRDNAIALGECAPRLLAALKKIAEDGTDSPIHIEAINAIREAEGKLQ